MSIKISQPDDYDIIFIGGEQLKQDTAEMVATGKAKFFEIESNEAKEIIAGHPELKGDIAIVANKDKEQGEACAISQVGKSIIVHCEDFIIPVKE